MFSAIGGEKNICICLVIFSLSINIERKTMMTKLNKDRYNEHRTMRCIEVGENMDNIDFFYKKQP